MAVNNDYPFPPKNPRLEEGYLRSLVNSIISCITGKTNNCGEFSLAASAASTTVKDKLCNANSVVLLTPISAHAAAEVGNGTIYVTPGKNQFVLTHANNAQTDRNFRYVIIG